MRKILIAATLFSAVGFLGIHQARAISLGGGLKVGGKSLNVAFLTISGVPSQGVSGTAQLSFPQSFPMKTAQTPPASVTSTSPLIITVPPTTTPTANYSCASGRPDFTYVPAKLGYQRQTSITLGQIDMSLGAGFPAGTNRYVPVGEF